MHNPLIMNKTKGKIMRNSILTTVAIAFVAGALALSLSQSEQFRSWVGLDNTVSSTQSDETTSSETASTETATDETVAQNEQQDTSSQETASTSDQPAYTPAPALADSTSGTTALNEQSPAAGEEAATEAKEEATEAVTEESSTPFTVDVAAALKDRVVGNADAPIVVEDYSSLTCPHCAFFHNSIYPKIKENYIDKGKVRWVFKGFPLNEPALRAEMVARCAPGDNFIKLTEYMYENQPKWAFAEDPMGTLGMMLRVAGVSSDVFTACATNSELELAMAKRIEEAAEKHDINSTPTFIVNGKKSIAGAGTYVGFAYDLDRILREKGLYEEPTTPEYTLDDAVPPAPATE